MKALTWQGKRDVRVENVPDPAIEQPHDAIVRVTSTNICGSDLHLYEVLGAFLEPGDILGHEAMGIVEEVGPEAAQHIQLGDRVVVPFNISCGRSTSPTSCRRPGRPWHTPTSPRAARSRCSGWAPVGIGDIMPLLLDDSDPLDTEGFATHHLPLEQAPHGYEIFQKKQEGCQKVVLRPWAQ